jgi:hypothetical protein
MFNLDFLSYLKIASRMFYDSNQETTISEIENSQQAHDPENRALTKTSDNQDS